MGVIFMKKILVIFMIVCIMGICGCSNGSETETSAKVQEANAQVVEETKYAYDCSTFFLNIPDDWIIHGSPGTNTLIGHNVDGNFNPGENTFWDLKVTNYIDDENPGESYPKSLAETVAERKHGQYVGEIQLENITLYEIEYRSGAYTQAEFFGISEIREDGENYKYYNIDFTLKNCPDDFRNNAMKILDGIKFNFIFDF